MKCPGHMRHWFTLGVGIRTPVCVRCGAPNPRKLTDDEWDELRGCRRVGHHVVAALSRHFGADFT